MNINETDKKNSMPAGFSLLEVVIAISLLGLVLLPFLSFVGQRLQHERRSDQRIRAIELGRNYLEMTLLNEKPHDAVEMIDEKYMIVVKVYDGDQSDEPVNLLPLEIKVTVFSAPDQVKLAEFRALH